MSNENDVPLGEGSRRYYDQLFADRIRQVAKGGDNAPRPDRPSSNSNGRAGCGVLIAVFIVIRLIAAFMNSHSHQTSYRSVAPSPPRFNAPVFPNNPAHDDDLHPLRRLMEKKRPILVEPKRALPEADQNALLTIDDVPFLEGLCYRMYQESLGAEATPGKHFLKLIDPDVQPLIVKAAHGIALDENEQKEIVAGLNEVLQHRDFWNQESLVRFRQLQEDSRMRDNALGLHIPPPGRLEERRLILQVCYAQQIVPLSERDKFGEKAREAWRRQARHDLDKARQKFERIKH